MGFALMFGLVCVMATGVLAQQVLVAGGATSCNGNGCTYTSSAEVFDPSTMSWTPTANDIPNPPPSGLCDSNMALLGNGTVLLAGGGCSNQDDTTNAASLYDPATNQWAPTGPGTPGTNVPYFMTYGRDQYGMVTIAGGNAFAFAGCSGGCTEPDNQGYDFFTLGNSAEIYNFQSNVWTLVAPLNTRRGNLETSNINQGAVLLQDGRVLTCNGSDGDINDIDSCEIYDPIANTWTLTGSIGETGFHQLALLTTGKVLTVLNDGLSSSLFDPTSGSWSPTGSLPDLQMGGYLVRLSDGRVLDCGGDNSGIPISTAQVYDPTTGLWSTTGFMTTARVGHIVVTLPDGTVLVAGGMNSNSVVVSSAEIFNPSLGMWSATAPMTLPRYEANALLIGNFSQQTYVLTVTTNGSGTVMSTDHDINCPGTCGNSYPVNTQVTLNATPAPGWTFAGWSGGGCSGTGSCTVTMTQNQSVMATFTQNTNFFTLSVAVSGSGTVTSMDMNINCPGVCSYTYPANMVVPLHETPGQVGGMFLGWNGACTGTGPCGVTMSQNQFVTASFTAQPDMVMHSFGNGIDNDGQKPFGSPVLDAAGNLYGTTSMNGMYGAGTVFEVSPNGTETVLYNFGNGNGDGQNPRGNLIFDAAGNLYGTTSVGGMFGNGTVFQLSPSGTETVLYNFGNGGDGQNPQAGLLFDGAGNLYGTTANGGGTGCGGNGCGTVFELSPNGAGGWTETVLYSFGGGTDGAHPFSGLIFDSAENLYGTTVNGGAFGEGTLFELSTHGCCRESLVYSFGNGGDGQNPYAAVIFDASGNLYGTTANGGGTGCGGNGCGTVFELSPNGGGGWTETFYGFGGGTDGAHPFSTLVFDNSGNLYGTTMNGGLNSQGTVFELSAHGCCRENPIYSFGTGSNDGQNPYAGLAFFSTSGTFYGTTVNGGGMNNGGTVFALAPGMPFVDLLPPSLAFGLQGVNAPSTPQTVVLANTGIASLLISGITIMGADPNDFSKNTDCPITLAPGKFCHITVVFSPVDSGTLNADVTISDNASNNPQMVPLTGISVGGKVRPR